NKLKSYLDFNIKTLASDFIAFDGLEQTKAKNVYIPYVNLNNFLFQHFGSFEYKHHSTVLIDKLLSNSNEEDKFYICVKNLQLDIIVISKGKLALYNTFDFTTKEDFIYYILFVIEQLKLNPDTLLLSLIGDITKESELYNITYQYIRNIEFSGLTNSNNYSKFLLT
ncbi:MAG: DUF3822 family protein, partial [Flavobacteriaceae bacterium]